ncbi:MAG: hypothetical protein M3M95_02920, partial [Pseudomonadota bacterium]|nr:hypothetical protein [Pseudomonadota bacterium]
RPEASLSAASGPPPRGPGERLLAELVKAADAKDRDAAERLVRQLPEAPDPPSFELAVAGVHLNEAEFRDLAEQVFAELVRRDPSYALGHYELGLLSIRDGRRHQAVDRFARAADLAPHEFRYRLWLAHMLHAVGAEEEGDRELEQLQPRSPGERAEAEVVRSFAAYLREFPQGRGQSLLQTVKRRYDWIDAGRLAGEIEAAIAERRPFALIRLGDGEGAFAEIGPEDEARYARLYGWMRQDWVRFLFGPGFDPEATGYSALTRTLMETAAEADVLGVPYPNWINHEYAISSVRGLPCTLNIHRWLLAHPPERAPMLCDQIVHIVLHNRGLIEPILRRAGRLTVISCLTGLCGLIQRRFGLDEVEFMAVPREYTAPHLRDAEHVDGAPFPEVYNAVMERLARPHAGRVFIIAAGTLGKFYAMQIKRHGGIALDLGSLVDGWMRLPSRAGYGEELAL